MSDKILWHLYWNIVGFAHTTVYYSSLIISMRQLKQSVPYYFALTRPYMDKVTMYM